MVMIVLMIVLMSVCVCVLQQVVLTWFEEHIQTAPESLQPVLYRLCALYGLTQLEKHMTPLTEGWCLLRLGGSSVCCVQG